MPEDKRAQEFNQFLEQGGVKRPAIDPEIEASLQTADLLSEASFSDEARPDPSMRARWEKTANPRPVKLPVRSQRFVRWEWASIALAMLALLFIYRQPVFAAVGSLLGYVYFPESGFVQVSGARVLQNAVIQENADRSLTVERGLASERSTVIWVRFSETARPLDGAWLELPDAARLELQSWTWSQDPADTTGGSITFPSIPNGVSDTVLALPEGWRIPLHWVSSGDVRLASADVVPVPARPVGGGGDSTGAGEQSPCVDKIGIRLCATAAWTDPQGSHVLVYGSPQDGPYLPGDPSSSMFLVPLPGDSSSAIILYDDQGSYWTHPDPAPHPALDQAGGLATTLNFPALSSAATYAVLSVPAFTAWQPFEQVIPVDLGTDPQPGTAIPLDVTLQIKDLPVHFSWAFVEGNDQQDLRLVLRSDPLQALDGLQVTLLDISRPEGVDASYGSGYDPYNHQLELTVELTSPQTGLKTGLLEIPVTAVHFTVTGPFELSFSAPAPDSTPPATPEAAVGGFTPPPDPEPLPMVDFQFTGREIQPGELLFSIWQGQDTALYASNPDGGYGSDLVAILPGRVTHFNLHPDRQGLDYITAEPDEQGEANRQARLFSLRFNEGTPQELFGPLEGTLVRPAWTADSTLLAYQVFLEQPGNNPVPLFIVNMAECRSGNCAPRQVELPAELDLYAPRWSPAPGPDGYQLSMPGSDELSQSHMGDIYLLDFDPAGNMISVKNLTATENIDDYAPTWQADGLALFYACTLSGEDPNLYRLCRNDVHPGQDEVAPERALPSSNILASPDGGGLAVLAYTHKTGAALMYMGFEDWNPRVLAEVEYPGLFQFSPSGAVIAFIKEQGGFLEVTPLDGADEVTVYSAGAGEQVSHFTWAR